MGSIDFVQILLFALPVLVAVTLHEAAHGFVALWCGDDTAKKAGRLTLNPLRHIDPVGTIILPLVLIASHAGFVFGYAKPVPVNFAALRQPRRDMALVAAAGPGMNILLALISGVLLSLALGGGASAAIGNTLLLSIELNFVLAVFNLLPVPPLDGSKIVGALLPPKLARPYLRLGRYGMAIILLLLLVLPLIAQRTGLGFDIFGTLVQRPADFLTAHVLEWIARS